jgi:hypothetical protein
MAHPSPDFQTIANDVSEAAMRLAHALRTAMHDVLPGQEGVRALGRSLRIDKNIASNAMRIVRAPDAATVLAALPGARAMATLIGAIEQAGATQAHIAALARAHAALRETLGTRGYDPRAVRALSAGAQDPKRVRDELRKAHRQSFEAARVIWGMHVRARIGAQLIAPSDDGTSCDLAALMLVHDIDRLGPGPMRIVYAPLIRYGDSSPAARGGLPLGDDPRIPALIRTLSSAGITDDEIGAGEGPLAQHAAFKARRADRSGPLGLCFGEVIRRIGSAYRTTPDSSGEAALPIGCATGVGQLDLLFHRSLVRGGDPVAAHYASHVRIGAAPDWSGALRLPMHESVEEVAAGDLPHALRAVAPAYRALLERGAGALGHRLQDFVCFRLSMPYPPAPSTLLLRWLLADPAG